MAEIELRHDYHENMQMTGRPLGFLGRALRPALALPEIAIK
jgi:hypothetical protein